jgi:putative Holliday junction resolvase
MNSSSDNSGPDSPSPDRGPRSTAATVPRQGRLLGLDYGTHRIGTALSTSDQTIASPLENYTLRSDAADAAFLREQVREYRVVGLVVGLPVRSQGEEGSKAREARKFGEWAATVTELPVVYADESYSTAAAEDLLREAGLNRRQRKARLDKLAAQLMLQMFLDRRERNSSD